MWKRGGGHNKGEGVRRKYQTPGERRKREKEQEDRSEQAKNKVQKRHEAQGREA